MFVVNLVTVGDFLKVMNHNSADTALSEILMVSCPIVDLTFRLYLVAWSRISESTSCEESAIFFENLAYLANFLEIHFIAGNQ